MKKILTLTFSFCIVLFSLNTFGQPVKKEVQDNKTNEKPVKAYFELSQRSFDFGTIPYGKTKTIEISFKNTGVKPLIIINTFTTCGCTSIEYPHEPFMPGKSGKLKISYSADELGFFNKTITINTNAENKKETIRIQGIVASE